MRQPVKPTSPPTWEPRMKTNKILTLATALLLGCSASVMAQTSDSSAGGTGRHAVNSASSAPGRFVSPSPTVLIFDSGLGGLTVHREVAAARPDARLIYAADDAAFPYGPMEESKLVARVLAVVGALIEQH